LSIREDTNTRPTVHTSYTSKIACVVVVVVKNKRFEVTREGERERERERERECLRRFQKRRR
jgi:hypothetical protein